MTGLSRESQIGIAKSAGAAIGAAGGIWVWWAIQLSWWLGLPLTIIAAAVAWTWIRLQLESTIARQRSSAPFVAASWACLLIPVVTFPIFLVATPHSAPASSRAAVSASTFSIVYPLGFAVLLGFVSIWGVRNWRPLGILIRSSIGIVAACAFAYLITMVVIGMNLWH